MGRTHAAVVVDCDGSICFWNREAELFFGYTPEEAIGRSLDLIVPPDFREQHWAGFRKAAATGEMKLDRATSNVPVLCKDGETRPFPGRFFFLQGPRGDVAGFAAVFAERTGQEEAFGPILPL